MRRGQSREAKKGRDENLKNKENEWRIGEKEVNKKNVNEGKEGIKKKF